MKNELSRDIKRNMNHICEVFSTLEFAYRNFDNTDSVTDIISIIGTAVHSGMNAFNELSDAIDKVTDK
jgi:hypothetical protein